MTAGATIVDLAAHPEYAEIVAFWVDREWAIFSKRSFAETLARYRDTPGPGKLPITLVALVGGHPCGVASLREKDSFDWLPDICHWVCGVYVSPDRRGMGVAGHLCRALEVRAVQLGIHQLHLATETEQDSLYHRLGYAEVGQTEHHGMNYLLRKSLLFNTTYGGGDDAR